MTRRYRSINAPLLLGLVFLLEDGSEAFVPNRLGFRPLHHRLPECSTPTTATTTTELSMGLRDFLSRRKTEKKENSKEPAPKSGVDTEAEAAIQKALDAADAARQEAAAISIPGLEEPRTAKKADTPKVRMGEDPSTGQINVQPLGPETAQERIARVKRGAMTQEEKEAFLRSALSTGNSATSRLPTINRSKQQSASPFPTDPILRVIAGGDKDKPLTPQEAMKMDSNTKKQKYLDMVTNPNRFDKYSKSGVATNKDKDQGDNDGEEVDDEEDSDTPSVPAIKAPADLGARLEAAAMANEKRNAELRKQALEKERELQRKNEEKKRLAEIAQQERQRELQRREAEIRARRKAQEAERAKILQQRQSANLAKQQELIKAQEDYWAKKLAEQKNKKPPEPAAETKKQDKVEVMNKEENVAEEEEDEEEEEEVEEKEPGKPVAPSFSPNTMINKAASEVFGSERKLNDVPPHSSDIQADLARKRAERDKQKDEQLERLRALNSPLPRPKLQSQQGTRVKRQAFEPQKPVTERGPTPAQSLGELTNTINKNKDGSTKSDSEKDSGFSWSRFVGNVGGSVNPAPPAPKPAPAPKSVPAPAKTVLAPVPSPAEPAVARKAPRPPPAPKPTPAPPARKGPIRMRIPVDDDDEEEDGAMTEGMTIGEIMKRQKNSGGDGNQDDRAKKWGVDMSRFT